MTPYLVDHLVLAHEYMGVILREAAHAHESVQRARKLMAVHKAQLPRASADRGMTTCGACRQHTPGQFMGLIAKGVSSMTLVYIFSR